MNVREIQAKSILRKQKVIDSWFISCYSMNFYRGCAHDCIYCDGRSEKYNVQHDFSDEITVKTNAIEILDRELSPTGKRKPLRKSFYLVGGGVGDTFQELEKSYHLGHRSLELFKKYKLPVHLLSKSTALLSDLDLIKEINSQSRALVSFSLSSSDDSLSAFLEPHASSASERLNAITKLKNENIPSGVCLMPVVPYITDTENILKKTLNDIKDAGADYIIFSGMTLKQGRQMDYFFSRLESYDRNLIKEYRKIYTGNTWGSPRWEYMQHIQEIFNRLTRGLGIPKRIPSCLFNDILSTNDTVAVILDQLDYLSQSIGRKTSYSTAARSIRSLDGPIDEFTTLGLLPGIGPVTEKIIQEIIATGNSRFYEQLIIA